MKQAHVIKCTYRVIDDTKPHSYNVRLDYRGMHACSPEGQILRTFRQTPENAQLDRDNAKNFLSGMAVPMIVDHTVPDYILLKKTEPKDRKQLIAERGILLPAFGD